MLTNRTDYIIIRFVTDADMAQEVERILGKDEVTSSTLVISSTQIRTTSVVLFCCSNQQKVVIVLTVKTAIFDMDGTLIDSLMLWDVMWSSFGETYLSNKNFRPTEQDDKLVRTVTLKAAMQLIHDRYGIADSGLELLERANNIIRDYYANKVELKEGVKEFLDYLAGQGVNMCIASATAMDLIETAVDHCGIGKYFQKIFSCATTGKGKEHPDIFLEAARYFDSKPHETCVFEDSLVAIKTAAKAGMHTVGIYDRYNFGQDEIKATANRYIAKGETLLKLIK